MRVSINVTDFSWRSGIPKGLARLAEAADDAGVDTVWAPDHLLQADPTAPAADRDMLEAYTALGFVAARTERVRLGTMVSAVTFRPPALLVKAITTLDVLTEGRAWLGVGAGRRHVGRRGVTLRRKALPARASGRVSAAGSPAAPADTGRRNG
jgi:alkanesulfonate monooxygenase SsuD/methylene tetrahydromethanopterin reductase-like flavin-dependent oxidoreductase (luciferase family)